MTDDQSPQALGIPLASTFAASCAAHEVERSWITANISRTLPAPHAYTRATKRGTGYIAGTGAGLLTIGGRVACCEILAMEADQLHQGFTHRTYSLANGHYLIDDLDPDRRYLVLARDDQGDYDPCVYDQVLPAADLSPEHIDQLWRQMTQEARGK